MLIKYKNITIRNAEQSDASQLAAWWNDGRVMAHAGFPNGLGTTAEKIARSLLSDSDEKGRRLIIELDGVSIGEMGYRTTDDGSAEIGIKICDFTMQDKGLGKVFLSLFISELFKMDYKKIILDTNLKNKRAQHVYERLGFTKLRINENAWKDQLGVPQSSVDYELYEKDFISFIL